jgi:prepilin-type N-terminal cleavage/methylation domain-containing protein
MIGNKRHFFGLSSRSGFSLAELIISLSIISLLSALFLANYHSSNQRTDLIMTAQTLVTDIRFSQANALGLIKYDGQTPAGGWGVALFSDEQNNGYYLLFADENDDERYNDGEASEALGGRRIDFSPNIFVDQITINGTEQSRANISFLPPDPLTRLRADIATGTVLEIRLKEKINNTTKTVRINFLGLVEVID